MKRATDLREDSDLTQVISIHALVKRATRNLVERDAGKVNFNPRPREEGDPVQARAILTIPYFNPRPREEGDLCDVNFKPLMIIISIHALVKRATIIASKWLLCLLYFNPRPREEGDYSLIMCF